MTTPTSDPVAALRALAARHEAEGRLDEADRLWNDAVASAPGDATTIDRLIALSHRRADFGRLAQALLARLNLTPGQAELWNDLGAALERLGQRESAQAAYRRALAVSPGFTPAILNKAFFGYRAGDYAQAGRLSERARATGATAGDTALILAHSAQNLGQSARAERNYAVALALGPGDGSAWQGLGALFLSASDIGAAWRCFSRAISLHPGEAGGLANLAEACRRRDQSAKALRLSRRAMALAPGLVVAHNTMALTHADQASDVAALAWARRACALDPTRRDLLLNLAIALKTMAHFDAAEQKIRRALAQQPLDPDAHLSLATTLLAKGDVREGLKEYEWRLVGGPTRYDVFPATRWDGSPIRDGGKLLVWGEQGLGDEIQFVQYLEAARRQAPHIVMECDPRLVTIFRRSFPGMDFIPRRDPPDPILFGKDISRQVSLMSIPHALNFSLADMVNTGPFLKPDPSLQAKMKDRLAHLPGLKVGIAWRTRNMNTAPARRIHTTLSSLHPVIMVEGASFISFQYDDASDEISNFNIRNEKKIVCVSDVDMTNNLEEVLALGANLDLMVSTSTSAYSLHAAAGVEIWLLHHVIDYLSFGQGRNPCWPNSRGFLGYSGQGWSGPIAEIAIALAERVRRDQADRLIAAR